MEMEITDYKPEMGENPVTQEMRELLQNKTLDEQLDYFVVSEEYEVESFSYGDSMGSRNSSFTHPLRKKISDKRSEVLGVIVADGIIVGAVFCNDSNDAFPALLNKWCCTYFASEDDGTGKREAVSHCRLVFSGNSAAL